MMQSMHGRYWCTSINSEMHPRLHEQLLLTIWNCRRNPRFVYPQCKVSCCWSMSKSHLGQNRTKQSYESKKWLSLVFQLRQKTYYLACAIARLMVMLARAIFRSCWRSCTCSHAHVRSHVSPGMEWFYFLDVWEDF